jgi:preprotein translocase subunit SecA
MFERLFGRSNRATQEHDKVWMTDAARMTGLCREVDLVLTGGGHSVVVVALTSSAFGALAEALSVHGPVRCPDAFERDNLRRKLAQGGSLVVAMPAALPADVQPDAEAPQVHVLVHGRNQSRAADDAIVRFADSLGSRARIVFHVSFDDPLLREHMKRIRPLMERLGMPPDEAFSDAGMSRAIRKAQSK